MDIGLRLVDMSGQGDFDIYEVIDDVNIALDKHGLKIKQFGKWGNFVDDYIKEKSFIENIITIVEEQDKS